MQWGRRIYLCDVLDRFMGLGCDYDRAVQELPPHYDGITVESLPHAYVYRATRYADLILRDAFERQFEDFRQALMAFRISFSELEEGGGSRTPFVRRFDDSLKARGWGKRNFDIETTIDQQTIAKMRSHEIDMFSQGSPDKPFPGIAVEMEWNNKDPFFDRDLTNFYALHRAGALAVGVIVTRGPGLQGAIKAKVTGGAQKYGVSTTHWTKLMARVDLGGGGECPLLLVGIETARIDDPSGVLST